MNGTPQRWWSPAWLLSLLLLGSCCPRVACCPAPPPTEVVTLQRMPDVHPQDDVTGPIVRFAPPAVDFEAVEDRLQGSPCDSTPPDPAVVVALTGGRTHEHEVHDCQRLVVRTGGVSRFGPLVAVYPIDQAMALTRRLDFSVWTPVANVYNWGTNDGSGARYAPLGIEHQWNCLWLRSNADGWMAALDTLACFEEDPATGAPRTGPGGSSSLEVLESRHRNGAAIYPMTARWGWSSADSVHYIGVKCGTAWCSVLPLRARPDIGARLTGPERRSIPGWFDEQHLAIPASGGGLTPGPLGRIYPGELHFSAHDDLPRLDTLFRRGLEAAEIEIEHAPSSYVDKFNLHVTPGGVVASSRIWVRIGQDTVSSYRNPLGESPRRAVNFIDHLHHAAQGAVRWRWRETDETAWLSCRSGCCDVAPEN